MKCLFSQRQLEILIKETTITNDAPSNSLKNSDENLKVETMEEERVKVCSLIRNTLGVKGTCWSSGMGTRMNSQVRVQDEINLHNQERKRLL